MIQAGDIINGEIVGGSNQLGYFDVSIGGSAPFLKVPAAHRKDQYFLGMDCVLGFINTDAPVIISRGFEKYFPIVSQPVTTNPYPWQCFGRDAWNTNRSDYEFSWDAENPFQWEHAFNGALNLCVAIVGEKDYIYYHSTTTAQCIDEDGNVIWSHTLPTITQPGTIYPSYGFLSDGKYYAVRIAWTDADSNMYVIIDSYEYDTGNYVDRAVADGIPPNINPNTGRKFIRPTRESEVLEGYSSHYFITLFDKCLIDGSFIAAQSDRNYSGLSCSISGKVVCARRKDNYSDIYFNGEYISMLNALDMSLITEIELPFSGWWESEWDREQEIVYGINAVKTETTTRIYVLTYREKTEKIGEGFTYYKDPAADAGETYPSITTNRKKYYNLYTFNENLTQIHKIEYLFIDYDLIHLLDGEDYITPISPIISVYGENIPVSILSIINDTKILCTLETYSWGAVPTISYEIIDPSTGVVNTIADLGYIVYAVTDNSNNTIFYNNTNTLGYTQAGILLFNKAVEVNSVAAGQNGVYGINYTANKIYRL